METCWQLQEAKNRLSDVIRQAMIRGPQMITLRGKPAVIVLSVETFLQLTRNPEPLSRFFAESPLKGMEIDFERDRDDRGRDISL